jgi:hypothetical protein
LLTGSGVTAEVTSSWVVGSRLVDCQVVPLSKAMEALAQLNAWTERPWSVTEAPDVSLVDRLLLHRLLHAEPLYPVSEAAWPRPDRHHLARLKLQVVRHLGRTVQVDMAGYRQHGDTASLTFSAQDLLGHALDGLLAAYEMTSPAVKWRSRLARLVPPNWEDQLSIQPTGRSLLERYWELHRAPATINIKACLRHALRITSFARSAFDWAERRLNDPDLPAARDDRRKSRPESLGSTGSWPYLELDVDFARSRDGVRIARLNEFGEALELTPAEFHWLLLLAGSSAATGASQARKPPALAADQVGMADEAASRGESLLQRVVAGGLCVKNRVA